MRALLVAALVLGLTAAPAGCAPRRRRGTSGPRGRPTSAALAGVARYVLP